MRVFLKILTFLFTMISVMMMIFTTVVAINMEENDRTLFGYKAYVVTSDSMKTDKGDAENGHFSAGDLVFVQQVDPSTLKEGDIITFKSTSAESEGQTVIHKIKTVTTDTHGNPAFVTYGTSTGSEDTSVTTYENVIGKYVGSVGGVGNFLSFFKTIPGYIIFILIPFIVLIFI